VVTQRDCRKEGIPNNFTRKDKNENKIEFEVAPLVYFTDHSLLPRMFGE
jgi:hypothetical protein